MLFLLLASMIGNIFPVIGNIFPQVRTFWPLREGSWIR